MRHLKPIDKPFDSRWNYIQHITIKIISFIVIWSWKCGNILRNKITSLRTLVNRVYSTTLNLFPVWISKPCDKSSEKPMIDGEQMARMCGKCTTIKEVD